MKVPVAALVQLVVVVGAGSARAGAAGGECDADARVAELSVKLARFEALEAKAAQLERALAEQQRAASGSLAAAQEAAAGAARRTAEQACGSKVASLEEKLSKAQAENRVLGGLKAQLEAAEGRVAKGEARAAEQRALHERELARCHKEGSDLNSQSWYVIALQRGSERLSEYRDEATVFYSAVLAPKAAEAWAKARREVAPRVAQAWAAAAPLRAEASKQFDTVRPQYENEVRPHVRRAADELRSLYAKADVHARRLSQEFMVHYGAFRKRSISTIKSHPSLAPMAAEIIDYSVGLVLLIIAALTVPTILSAALGFVRFLICRVLLCGCCCGRKRVQSSPPRKQPQQPQQHPQQPKKNGGGPVTANKQKGSL
jgi:hypothetical protein